MSVMSSDVVWRGMTREECDVAYNNAGAVANSADIVAGWRERSARFRAEHNDMLDLQYGERPRNRVDVFHCGRSDAPLFAFIHGGYWQRNDKETFACMAEGPLASGFDVAMIGYTLAPDVSLTEIVAEIKTAVRFLRGRLTNPRLILGGWSAGGHLTATAIGMPEVDAGFAISGIFDVEPCRLNYVNDKLNLTAAEAQSMSPIHHLPATSGPFAIAYGTVELPELQRQSKDYWRAWQDAGLAGVLLPRQGDDHFSILEELAAPGGELVVALSAL